MLKLGYASLFSQELPAYTYGDCDHWWNGVYIAVISKNGGSKQLTPAIDKGASTLIHNCSRHRVSFWIPKGISSY